MPRSHGPLPDADSLMFYKFIRCNQCRSREVDGGSWIDDIETSDMVMLHEHHKEINMDKAGFQCNHNPPPL